MIAVLVGLMLLAIAINCQMRENAIAVLIVLRILAIAMYK